MTSLAEWMRKSLLWESSYPSAEELAEEYIRSLKEHMRKQPDFKSGDSSLKKGYQLAFSDALKFLRGEETKTGGEA